MSTTRWRRAAAARPSKARPRRLVRRAAVLVSVLAAVACCSYVAVRTALPVFRFPRPSGPHAIGTLTYHWVDERPELLSADAGDRRELMAQVWYPAEDVPAAPRAPYVSDPDGLASALSKVFGMPRVMFRALGSVTTHASPAAPMAVDGARYPVLIFLEGLGGFRQMSTFQVEELVSHGYVVVALDQPYTAASVRFPDGREVTMPAPLEEMKSLVRQSYRPADQAPTLHGTTFDEGIVPQLAADVSFALDRLTSLDAEDPRHRLTGRLDLRRVGVFGVSLGGIVAAEACRIEPRLGACLAIDAPMPTRVKREGLQRPTMWITRPADDMRLEREQSGGWPEEEIEAHQRSMRATFDKLATDGYFVNVRGMFHLNPTDLPLWSPLFSWLDAVGPIEVERAHTIVNAFSLAFFDRHLEHEEAALLDGGSDKFPEVEVETHRSAPR